MKRPIRQLFASICLLLALLVLGTQAGAQESSRIRVYLKRLQVQDSLHITVQGTYMLEGGNIYLQDGAQVVVALRGNQLVLHTDGMAVALGEKATLLRCAGETPGALLLQGQS